MRALFLDRDGVINVQIVDGYVTDPQQFIFMDGVMEALQILHTCFDKVLLVTNQQCVGKGLCTIDQIRRVHDYMQQQLATCGVPFDKIYCCPHLASDHCTCRKPNTGMAQQAKLDYPDLDLSHSMMAGDALSDMQFALHAGLCPIHLGAVRHPEYEQIQQITPLHFDSLLQFARSLL